MNKDINYLLQATGLSDFPYREIAETEEQRSAIERWPLLAEVSKVLKFIGQQVASVHRATPEAMLSGTDSVAKA